MRHVSPNSHDFWKLTVRAFREFTATFKQTINISARLNALGVICFTMIFTSHLQVFIAKLSYKKCRTLGVDAFLVSRSRPKLKSLKMTLKLNLEHDLDGDLEP